MADTKFKIYQMDNAPFDITKHPNTMRIEMYWRGQSIWAMVADAEPLEGMMEEATRVFKKMAFSIAQKLDKSERYREGL